MIKKLIPVLAIVCALTAAAQEAKKASMEPKRISIGVNFSPDFCFRTLKENDGSYSANQLLKTRNNNEMAMFAYSAGLLFYFNPTDNFAWETGIQYAHRGYQTKKLKLMYEQPGPTEPESMNTTYDYYYIDMPLIATFIFGKSKLRFLTSVGFSTNILIEENQSMTFQYADGRKKSNTSGTDYKNRKLNISPQVSIGIDYKVNDKINIRLEPTFRYGILNTANTPVAAYLLSAGLNTGLSCRLN
jgi:hypothetical protein